MKALLIIDMQQVSFTPETPRYDADGVVERINSLATKFRKNGDLVIYIQHDGSADDFCKLGSQEWKLLPTLVVEPSDLMISKTANSAFYKTNLKEELIKHRVKKLVITGCATDFCVDSTVKSAITEDYDLTIISNAHTTADRPHVKAKQVIDHYNWIWSEMTGTKARVQVI